MIYSVHNPVTGAFDYFEGGPDTPINDDLPTPRLRSGKIGVAATAAGRPLPPGVRRVGSGPLPVGSISSGQPGLWKGTAKGSPPSGIAGLAAFDVSRAQFALGSVLGVALAVGAYLAYRSSKTPATSPELDYAGMRRGRPW